MASRILQGDVFDMLPTIEPGSVDCAVTSPPYWMLRSYLPKGHPLKHLEIGQEKTPAEYVSKMVRVFELVRDCLAEHGTLWVNCGDTYAQSQAGRRRNGSGPIASACKKSAECPGETLKFEIESGSLSLIPQRLTIAMQDAGWLVRSIVIWHKPAPMPASVSGWAWRRCRVKMASKDCSHMKDGRSSNGCAMRPHSGDTMRTKTEWSDCPGCKKCAPGGYVLRSGSWRPTSSYEPIIMLAKSAKYFCDGEPVKTMAAPATISRNEYTRVLDDEDEQFAVRHDHESNMTTANLRDVWTIAAEPLKEKHYAAYPTELVRRCLQAGVSAKGYCRTCGGPWVRVVESPYRGDNHGLRDDPHSGGSLAQCPREAYSETKTIGWRPSCTCQDNEPRPGLVLDPFCGSGRTGITAARLGFDFVGCELNGDYVTMAERKMFEDSPLFS